MDNSSDGGSIFYASDSGSEGGVLKWKRRRKTAFQMETLEKAFAVYRDPSRKVQARLSVQLDLTVSQVRKWFCYRRLKDERTPPVERSEKEFSSSGGGVVDCMVASGSSPETLSSHVSDLNWGKTKKRARRNTNTLKNRDVKITKTSPNNRTHLPATGIQNGYNTVKTMGETRERAWTNTETPMKKLKSTQKESCDVIIIEDDEFLDPKLESCDSVKKLSSPQSVTVCVQGYQVKRSNAPILKAIFKKHGDIAAKCLFETDIVRSSFLEIVCDLVRQIHTSNIIENMEEIDRRVTAAEAANVNVTWLRAHFRKKMELFKKSNLLMETKKNTILARCAAQKDLKEAEERVELLDLLEKNLNDALMESKGELDSLLQQEFL